MDDTEGLYTVKHGGCSGEVHAPVGAGSLSDEFTYVLPVSVGLCL